MMMATISRVNNTIDESVKSQILKAPHMREVGRTYHHSIGVCTMLCDEERSQYLVTNGKETIYLTH